MRNVVLRVALASHFLYANDGILEHLFRIRVFFVFRRCSFRSGNVAGLLLLHLEQIVGDAKLEKWPRQDPD